MTELCLHYHIWNMVSFSKHATHCKDLALYTVMVPHRVALMLDFEIRYRKIARLNTSQCALPACMQQTSLRDFIPTWPLLAGHLQLRFVYIVIMFICSFWQEKKERGNPEWVGQEAFWKLLEAQSRLLLPVAGKWPLINLWGKVNWNSIMIMCDCVYTPAHELISPGTSM